MLFWFNLQTFIFSKNCAKTSNPPWENLIINSPFWYCKNNWVKLSPENKKDEKNKHCQNKTKNKTDKKRPAKTKTQKKKEFYLILDLTRWCCAAWPRVTPCPNLAPRSWAWQTFSGSRSSPSWSTERLGPHLALWHSFCHSWST